MNPYESLAPKAFWKPAVARRSMFDIAELWDPKWRITRGHKIVTYGSCFAQHIGRALEARGCQWFRPESGPPGMRPETAKRFNYGIFSSRTGNIYTASLLSQWSKWALDGHDQPEEIWERNGRYIDPFRPRIEPDGFESVHELLASRKATVDAFETSIRDADIFVFTLGLTESWFNRESGYEYPMCPGTAAGEFDADRHVFRNQTFPEILKSLAQTIERMRAANPKLRFILTVSPVPLVATMSQRHVLVATMASKSILRAVADQLSTNRPYIDYFPSYEIINSPAFRGTFFEPNQREVNPAGVGLVMDTFFRCQEDRFGPLAPAAKSRGPSPDPDPDSDLVCEEILLEAFHGA